MTIQFTAEGGFREVPDPPKPKRFVYRILNGPSESELFSAIRNYPQKKVIFDIYSQSNDDPIFKLIPSVICEVFVSEIRVLLEPVDTGEKITIERIKNCWLGQGFVKNQDEFVYITFFYKCNAKERTGELAFTVKEES